MAGTDHAPPPFFKRGPAPLALLIFYVALSIALFVVDLRFRSLELIRQSIALFVDPVQRVAQTPGSLVDYARTYLEGLHQMQEENATLRHAQLNTAPDLQRLAQLEAEVQRPSIQLNHQRIEVIVTAAQPATAPRSDRNRRYHHTAFLRPQSAALALRTSGRGCRHRLAVG